MPLNECLIRVKAFSINRGKLKRSQNHPLGTPIGWDVVSVAEQTAQDGSDPPAGTNQQREINLIAEGDFVTALGDLTIKDEDGLVETCSIGLSMT